MSDIRAFAIYVFNCHAPEDYFLDWEDTPQDVKDEIERNGGIPCEGGGVPDEWCARCRFGTYERIDAEDAQS